MSHSDHEWPKTSLDEENNNRYQPVAPLIVWCGRCRAYLPADDRWVEMAAQGDDRILEILLTKAHRWDGRTVVIEDVSVDPRGRLTVRFHEKLISPSVWLQRLLRRH